MSIDKVTTRTATSYVPARRKANTKFSVDGITPVDKPPAAADEESRGQRDRQTSTDKQSQEESSKQEGSIDERL